MYGKKYMGTTRSTFIIGDEGKLIFAKYNVKAKGHVDLLIEELGLWGFSVRNSEIIKKDIVQFLQLCITYSNDSLKRKSEWKLNLDGEDLDEINNEIEKWKNYVEFTEYTIKEISNGELDHWINNLNNPEFHPKPNEN